MKAYGRAEEFFDLAQDGGEWSASRTDRFAPGEGPPWYSLDRRLDGPQMGVEAGIEPLSSST
jgi:hypothetical protein